MNNPIYQEALNQLIASGTISADSIVSDDSFVSDAQSIIKILDSSYDLEYDEVEDVLYYIDKDGEKHVAPDLSAGMTTSDVWLHTKLPPVFIDLDQGGNVRKAEESRSIYSIICIGAVIPSFKPEIKDFLKNYDFNSFTMRKRISRRYENAVGYLKTFLDENSLRINVIKSCSDINISQSIEKKEQFWKSALTQSEISECSKISRLVKNVISKYERESGLNPDDIKDLDQIQKLQLIANRDAEIEVIINQSPLGILYKISKLSSERLSATVKRSVSTAAEKIAIEEVKLNPELVGRDADELFENTFKANLRRLTSMCVSTLRQNEIIKYKNDPKSYRFRKKA